ncbi:hypothetical protein GCM10025865_07840 [Paraoerskovia sediminicola]|uniref:Rieske domain-containing protein n=1 Tax=Paraoerskovia sediminicola TaxID=1138587 RepID=A0ABN6X9E7_9CELL|nr:nitrite reductase small subunit NirD [Paraoerskovia sediminicola]BDZ41485.1 hypothetical protein GCM10025865_07840 [Paraoerskovia sediminicola]
MSAETTAQHATPGSRTSGITDAAVRVCLARDLPVERGAAALLGTVQVALFRLADGSVHAVQQVDPFSGANVMSRGIVGTRSGEPTVAGPMYKQVYSLHTGECLERAGYEPVAGHEPRLRVHPVEVRDGVVLVEPVARPAVLPDVVLDPAGSGGAADGPDAPAVADDAAQDVK